MDLSDIKHLIGEARTRLYARSRFESFIHAKLRASRIHSIIYSCNYRESNYAIAQQHIALLLYFLDDPRINIAVCAVKMIGHLRPTWIRSFNPTGNKMKSIKLEIGVIK